MSSKFNKTDEAEYRRVIRRAVRSGPFTKSQRDVVLAFVNHWLEHRKSTKGVVHPGRKRLAKKSGVSIKTVARTLDLLRQHGAVVAMAHLNGLHGNATEYVVDQIALTELCAKKKSDLRVNGGTNVPALGRDKMSHRSSDAKNNVYKFPYQDVKASGGVK